MPALAAMPRQGAPCKWQSKCITLYSILAYTIYFFFLAFWLDPAEKMPHEAHSLPRKVAAGSFMLSFSFVFHSLPQQSLFIFVFYLIYLHHYNYWAFFCQVMSKSKKRPGLWITVRGSQLLPVSFILILRLTENDFYQTLARRMSEILEFRPQQSSCRTRWQFVTNLVRISSTHFEDNKEEEKGIKIMSLTSTLL